MNEWVAKQENPSHRFTELTPWSDTTINLNHIEEQLLIENIKKFIQKIMKHNYTEPLSKGDTSILQSLLTKYTKINTNASTLAAMNLQGNQLTSLVNAFKIREAYVKHVKNQEKVLCGISKSKYLKSKQLDLLEKKLKQDVDSIESTTIISNFDTVLKPIMTELQEEEGMLREGLYDNTEGLLTAQLRNVLMSCMPELSDNSLKNAIVDKCLKECL